MNATELLVECDARKIVLQPRGGRLDIDAPEGELMPDLLARLREHKRELLRLLDELQPQGSDSPAAGVGDGPADLQPQESTARPADGSQYGDAAEWQEFIDPDGRRCLVRADAAELEIIDVPAPCPVCGGIVFWWDVAGNTHCEACSPLRRSEALRALAAEIRRRHPPRPDERHPTPAAPVPKTRPAETARTDDGPPRKKRISLLDG